MKFYKHIAVSFLVAILTIFAVYGGYSLYANTGGTNYDDFYSFNHVSSNASFAELQSAYHSSMNDFFNYKFDLMANLIDNNAKFYEHKDFKAPKSDSDANITEVCKTNVSTYCTAMGALDLYLDYLSQLNAMKGTVPLVSSSTPSVKIIMDLVGTRGGEIDQDAKDSKVVMEATISVYNEFQSAYPMHKKYREIIDNLTKYKIALGKIQTQTAEFPLRFIDATSDSCE